MRRASVWGPALCLSFVVRAQFGPAIPLVELTNTSSYSAVEVFDADSDGDLDLVLGSNNGPDGGFLTLRYNQGNGVFGAFQVIVPPQEYVHPKELATGDLDGDGDADIVRFADGASNNDLRWYRNDGTGVFSAANLLMGEVPSSECVLSLADIEPDGDLDLICSSASSTWVFRNSGTGYFGTAQTIADFGDCVAADLDQDGDMDLAGRNGSGMEMSLWTGSTYADPQYLGTGDPWARRSHIGDLNADGLTDILLATTTGARYLINQGGGTFAPVQSLAVGVDIEGLRLADRTGDGYPDILAYTMEGDLHSVVNDGAGNFLPAALLSGGNAIGFIGQLELADVNGDGQLDALYRLGGAVHCSWGLPGDQLAPRTCIVPFSANSAHPGAADMDDDGDLDVLFGGTWVEYEGGGLFGEVHTINTGRLCTMPMGLRAADLDGDGRLDVYEGKIPGGSDYAMWYRDQGDGTYEQRIVDDDDFDLRQMQHVDVEGDGDLDLFRASGYGTREYRNTGDGTFVPGSGGNSYASYFVLADFDGDGDTDMITDLDAPNSEVVCYLNDGVSQMLLCPYEHLDDIFDPLVSEGHAFNPDGDADMDVVFVIGNEIRWYRNVNNGGWLNQSLATDALHLDVGDVNADGLVDLIYGTTSFTLVYRLGNGSGSFGAAVTLPVPGGYYQKPLLCDVDADGDQDLLLSGYQPMALYLNYTINPGEATGKVFIDADTDGVFNGDDTGTPFVPVSFDPAQGYVFTDGAGAYSLRGVPGTYTVTALSPSPNWELSSDSASYTFAIDGTPLVHDSLDFGFAALVDTTEVEVALTSANVRCGEAINQWISIVNLGTQAESGYVRMVTDTLMGLSGSVPPPDSIVDGTWYWSYADLHVFEPRTITLQAQVPDFTYMGTPVASQLTAFVTDDGGPVTDSSTYAWVDTITCAYDPNDKRVEPVGFGTAHAVDIDIPEFRYTVRFQNTGTDTALNVVVRDPIDPDLDPSTIHILGSSHTLTGLSVSTANVALFRFDDIQLPDSGANEPASHGFVRFSIQPRPDRPSGAVVNNAVEILFDENPPVLTNTVMNTLVDCDLFSAAISTTNGIVLTATAGVAYQWFLNDEPVPGATAQTWQAQQNGTYTVQVTSTFGCVAMSASHAVTTTGIQDAEHSAWMVFPNPGNGEVTVVADAPIGADTRIELVDMQGRTVYSTRGNGSRQLHLAPGPMASGSYLLRIQPTDAAPVLRPVMVR